MSMEKKMKNKRKIAILYIVFSFKAISFLNISVDIRFYFMVELMSGRELFVSISYISVKPSNQKLTIKRMDFNFRIFC